MKPKIYDYRAIIDDGARMRDDSDRMRCEIFDTANSYEVLASTRDVVFAGKIVDALTPPNVNGAGSSPHEI